MPFDAQRYETDPVLRTLLGARALVAKGWCRGALARNQAGQPVPWAAPDAVTYCLAGATYRAGMEVSRGTVGALLLLMQRAEPFTVATTNDSVFTSQADALTFLDRIIEARRAELRASLSARVEA